MTTEQMPDRTHRPPLHRAARACGRIASTAVMTIGVIAALLIVVPTLLGYDRYVIAGKSMTGSLSLGDLVFEKPVPVDELEVGDIITYMPPAETGVPNLVTHRIVEIDLHDQGLRTFRTKGDANADVDPWTFQLDAEKQARYSFSVPYIGWVLMALGNRTFRMLIIGVPAVFIALMTLRDMIVDRRAERGAPVAEIAA